MTHIEKIVKASDALKAAQDGLTKAVKTAFPEDCSISVRLGRANIVATVTGYGTGKWAGEMTVVNQHSGKRRSFHVLYNRPTRLGV